MTRKPFFPLVTCSFLAIAATLAIMTSGCKPTCDSVPNEALAQVRILNAVSNSPLILVYVDGKLFDSAWYDIGNKYAAVNPHHVFGYRTTYLSDGSGLRAGIHHVAAMDAQSRDTVATWDGILHGFRQSLIFPGKIGGSPAQLPKGRVRYTNDIVREPEARSYARFIDAVPDIGGQNAQGLDVYFSKTPVTVGGKAHPDLRIRFDSISHNNGLDNGTGLDSNDYLEFPTNVPGLLVMPIDDTDVNNSILSVQYNLGTSGLLFTVVIRGETEPVGDDPITSTILLQDGQESQGTASVEIQSFAIRMVNATRYPKLSLLIKGIFDTLPRAGIPVGAGQGVLYLGPDSVGEYIPLNPTYDGDANFWFSKTTDSPPDTIFHFYHVDTVNQRTTFIAIDTIAHNTGTPGIDSIVLLDNVSSPVNILMGRVRFVNTSADYTANFTFAGKSFSLKQRGVAYADTALGTYSISINNGAGMITFPVQNVTPTTVFFMPTDATHPIPYRVSTQ
jgi:hypothetical protein